MENPYRNDPSTNCGSDMSKTASPATASFSLPYSPEARKDVSPASVSASASEKACEEELVPSSYGLPRISTMTNIPFEPMKRQNELTSTYGSGDDSSNHLSSTTYDHGHASSYRHASGSAGTQGTKLVHRGAATHYSSRRTSQDYSSSTSSQPPSLLYEETTLSSDSNSTSNPVSLSNGNLGASANGIKRNASHHSRPVTLPSLSVLNREEGMYVSPEQPLQLSDRKAATLPLSNGVHAVNSSSNARHGSSMAALLMAGEIASRDAGVDKARKEDFRTRRDYRH